MIAYDIIGPRWASNFYHVYTETVLETLLTVFWLVSLAGIAAYVSGHNSVTSFSAYLGVFGFEDSKVIQHDKRSIACLTAVAVFGGVML